MTNAVETVETAETAAGGVIGTLGGCIDEQLGEGGRIVSQAIEWLSEKGLGFAVNLAVVNLLPIPGLDGSRFLFLVLEAIRRKPLPAKREAMVNMVGMALLLALMVFFTYKDIAKLLQ